MNFLLVRVKEEGFSINEVSRKSFILYNDCKSLTFCLDTALSIYCIYLFHNLF